MRALALALAVAALAPAVAAAQHADAQSEDAPSAPEVDPPDAADTPADHPPEDPDELEAGAAIPAPPPDDGGSSVSAPPARDTSPGASSPGASSAYGPREEGGFAVALDVVPQGGHPFTVRAIPREGAGTPTCVAPCRIVLTPGYYDFEVGDSEGRDLVRSDGNPIRVMPGRRSILAVHHDHRAGHRVAGWIVLTVALHGLAASFLPAALGAGFIGPLAIGLPVSSPFIAIALSLMFMQDRARVELFRPSFADR